MDTSNFQILNNTKLAEMEDDVALAFVLAFFMADHTIGEDIAKRQRWKKYEITINQ